MFILIWFTIQKRRGKIQTGDKKMSTKVCQSFCILGPSSLGVLGVPWHTQILGDQVTLFQPGGKDYAHLITTGTPGFSDLPKALYIPDFHTWHSSDIVFKHMNQIIFQNLKFWILVIFRAALNSMPNTIFLPLQASELSNFCKLILKFQGNQHCFLGRRLYFCAVLLNGGWPLWPN